MKSPFIISLLAASVGLAACTSTATNNAEQAKAKLAPTEYYGTLEPFSKEAIYFLMLDRFVDGDSGNNHEDQGGEHPTFNLELKGPDGQTANVGYMGGDLKGVIDNTDFIADMGFTAVWTTPILDNPDEAFAGGEPIEFGGMFRDGGKTGYHGYWADNFYKIDEHYPSAGLDYKAYVQKLHSAGLKSVFDIVGNHGSPSFSMPVDQPKFGELYDINDKLVADHQNLKPEELDPNNPLHTFYHTFPDIAQLSNLNEEDPGLRDYLINSYLYWIEQGADAIRIDTIKHVPHHFWKETSDRIRAQHPGYFMFGESFDYNANFIAQHTLPKNGGVSVLDFPGREAMVKVFEHPDSDFAELKGYLHLTHGPYTNPYELTTFYDNHDMPRMNASDNGFIDAHNWLFTSRGIPVVYMGSEMGFMRGKSEHQGNRNYYGQDNIELAKTHPIHNALSKIANVRKHTPALQNGLQVNVLLKGNQAVFYRVLQTQDEAQTALVLLNKSDTPKQMSVSQYLQGGVWQEQLNGDVKSIEDGQALESLVAPHGVQVWVRSGEVTQPDMVKQLTELMADK